MANMRPLTVPPVLTLVLALAQFAAPSLAQSPAPATTPAKYELPAIPDEFKDADAIILSWDQKWFVAGDGAMTQHESKRVLIKHDRAVGAFADPRITYNKDWQTVKVITARTLTPDGRVLDVPSYSRNTVAPGESAGWPAFAAIEQIVLTYSAVEPGAILELEWERVTKPNMKRGMANANLRIAERIAVDYPTIERTIQIGDNNAKASRWTHVGADRDEPQSIPAIERCLHYCLNPDAAASGMSAEFTRFDAKSLTFGTETRSKVSAIVKKWVDGRVGVVGKAREICSQFTKIFNIVNVNDDFISDPMRPLDEIFESRYGSHGEATALLLALFNEAGLDAEPYAVISKLGKDPAWWPSIASYGIVLIDEGKVSFWSASHGRMRDPLSARNQIVVTRDYSSPIGKAVQKVEFPDDLSIVSITGNITIADDHKWTGQVDLRCTGVFCDAPALRTEDERKNFAREIIERILPRCIVESTSIASLSDDEVRLGVKIKTDEPLSTADGHRLLQFAAHGPHGRSIGIPLSTSIRRTDLRLASRFDEKVALTIELPKDITLVSMPREISKKGTWGHATQSARKTDNRITWERHIAVNKRDIPAADYASLRDALSDIQTDSARTFIWKSPETATQKVN